MPPHVPRKRHRNDEMDESPAHAPPAKRERVAKSKKTPSSQSKAVKGKQSLFDAVDGVERPKRTVEENKRFLEEQKGGEDEEEEEEEDSDDDEDFEDVPGIARASAHTHQIQNHKKNAKQGTDEEGSADEDEDEDEMDWEDAIPSASRSAGEGADTPINDISITLPAPGTGISTTNLAFADARGVVGKKGPSKIERQIRLTTHCVHVQFLMYHNCIRNSWLQDTEVQNILVGQLSEGLIAEVERWRKAVGLKLPDEDTTDTPSKSAGKPMAKSSKGKERAKNKSSTITERETRDRVRDWGADAERLEPDTPDLSHGDPTIRLLKFLAAYWRKRFRITAPSLQKCGYLAPAELQAEVKDWLEDSDDAERFGEKIKSKEELRIAAKKCEGSRDVGAQLFTALLRGVGLEARMVASLQPVGFGFSKAEDGNPRKKKESTVQQETSRKPESTPTRKSTRGNTKAAAISLDTSSSDELSDAPSDISTSPSIIDVTSKMSKKPIKAQNASPFPTYWTEVFSPVTKTFIPVVCLPSPLIANSPDLLASFTPSGKAAEKAKQVLAYVIGFSADGTAKDVTVRYLKKKQWPGKTKGVRVAKEKLPIYGRNGKVKKYIDWDWFAQVMSGYAKDPRIRTEAEEMEDEVELKPVAASKDTGADNGDGKVGGKPESLQAYKNSAEFVLGRHLRREEAILPNAAPVRHFTVGKGEKATTEPVFRRADVVTCKTVESWHKDGREVKHGEQPLKLVPIRAVTLIRKREVEDAHRETGEKPTQGLYSESQTDWIIPDPIGEDRKIPRNGFGNIDVYVSSMVPAGAVHVPLKGTAKLCKKLGIDFAEACTGFEFGKQRAVPVLTGVVVAEENEDLVKDAWRAEQVRVREREEKKKSEVALGMWKKFLQGLKIMERMHGEYGK
ncbi:Rad4-domain-containing protein, partial [Rhizodiscina lignyota]